jgi:serine/threonine protein phosphatase PrpC
MAAQPHTITCSFGVSEAGARAGNEDCYFADDALGLFIVADGLGGHLAGEVASRLAVDSLEHFMRRSEDSSDLSWPLGIDANLSLEGNRVRTALHLAHRRVLRAAEGSEEYTGMGTTAVCAFIRGGQLVVGHVGDSRLYLLARGALCQLTTDDTWIAALAASGTADPAALATHPMRHVLTNVLGASEQVEIHVSEHPLTGGEVLLLCSDGVHDVLDPTALVQLLSSASDPHTAARAVAGAAIERGTHDNVTALLVHYNGGGA